MFKREETRDIRERVSSMDRKIDPAVAGLAREALEATKDHSIEQMEKDAKWQKLKVSLMRAKWNPNMVESALDGVREFTEATSDARDHQAAFRFYNQMMINGKEKAFNVIHTNTHTDRLLNATKKRPYAPTNQRLQQYLSDWIAMYDNIEGSDDPCSEFYRLQQELPGSPPAASAEAHAFKADLHDGYYDDKDAFGYEKHHAALRT